MTPTEWKIQVAVELLDSLSDNRLARVICSQVYITKQNVKKKTFLTTDIGISFHLIVPRSSSASTRGLFKFIARIRICPYWSYREKRRTVFKTEKNSRSPSGQISFGINIAQRHDIIWYVTFYLFLAL